MNRTSIAPVPPQNSDMVAWGYCKSLITQCFKDNEFVFSTNLKKADARARVHYCRVFFPREPRKSAREQFRKSAREHLKLPVNFWKKSCPWTQKSAREPQKCPWTFSEKSAREPAKSAREHANSCIFGTFEEKVPVNREKCPWTFPNFLPVNHEKCPWKSPKKCPWTHTLAREFSEKVPVNAKLCPWTSSKKGGSRALLMFTGKKKHCNWVSTSHSFSEGPAPETIS